MSDFNKAIAFTLKWEGGYSDIADDRGKITYAGITKINHPEWEGWAILRTLNPKQGKIYPQLNDLVHEFYRTKYWGRIGEICNDAVAAFTFDFKVNSGNYAIKALQRIVGAEDDGILGNETISKVNNYNGNIIADLMQSRRNFYYEIVHNKPSQKKFLNGWLNRIDNFKATFHV